MKSVLSLSTCLLFSLVLSCAGNRAAKLEDASGDPFVHQPKINGIALAAPARPVKDSVFLQLKNDYANWVCLLPFAFVPSDKPVIYYNPRFQMWGERAEGILSCVKMAHAEGMKVMLKPQLWVSHGEYTGSLSFKDSADWKSFENSYSDYILMMAKIADSSHIEILCIGTEMGSFMMLKPQYWSSLIDSVRKVYHGQLTYAENWDCYSRCMVWNKLDYIGVNAYFPLCDSASPSVDELEKQWAPYVDSLKNFSEKENKSILFTEFGYRSIDACASKPYESYTKANSNYQAQMHAFEALFESCWNEPWFAGGFAWKWFDSPFEMDMPMEIDYYFQGKPAEAVLKKWYKNDE